MTVLALTGRAKRTVRETSLKIIEGQDMYTSRFALQTVLSNFQKRTDMQVATSQEEREEHNDSPITRSVTQLNHISAKRYRRRLSYTAPNQEDTSLPHNVGRKEST